MRKDRNQSTANEGREPRGRRPYRAPELWNYGDIHELTQATLKLTGGLDGVMTLKTK